MIIELPDRGVELEFPDEMPLDKVKEVIQSRFYAPPSDLDPPEVLTSEVGVDSTPAVDRASGVGAEFLGSVNTGTGALVQDVSRATGYLASRVAEGPVQNQFGAEMDPGTLRTADPGAGVTDSLQDYRPEALDKMAEFFLHNGQKLKEIAEKSGISEGEKIVADVFGGAPAGILSFMLGPGWAALSGAATAAESGGDELYGASVEAVKRLLLGGVFKGAQMLKPGMRIPSVMGIGAAQTYAAGERDPAQIAKGAMELGLLDIGVGGRGHGNVGARELLEPLRQRIEARQYEKAAENAEDVAKDVERIRKAAEKEKASEAEEPPPEPTGEGSVSDQEAAARANGETPEGWDLDFVMKTSKGEEVFHYTGNGLPKDDPLYGFSVALKDGEKITDRIEKKRREVVGEPEKAQSEHNPFQEFDIAGFDFADASEGVGISGEGVDERVLSEAERDKGVYTPASIAAGLSIEDTEGKEVPSDEIKVGQDLDTTHTVKNRKFIGAPRGMTPARLGKVRRIIRSLTKEGEPGRYWYERSSEAVKKLFPGNQKAQEDFVQFLAMMSPQTDISANMTAAIQAYYQYLNGEPILAHRFPIPNDLANKAFYGDRTWEGRKTNSFFNNLMARIDPSKSTPAGTVDMWMYRIFGYPSEKGGGPQSYGFIERELKKVADEMGWDVHQVQAAVWVAAKARMEATRKSTQEWAVSRGLAKWVEGRQKKKNGERQKVFTPVDKDAARRIADKWIENSTRAVFDQERLEAAKKDFADALDERTGQVSYEATPGDETGHLPWLEKAPYEVRKEYFNEIDAARRDENGVDLWQKELSLPGPMFEAPGGYKGDVNPSGQLLVPMVPGRGEKGKVAESAKRRIEAYAAGIGLWNKQNSVGWHRPFKAGVKNSNVADINAGRPMTENETLAIYRQLKAVTGFDLTPVPTPAGVRIMNFDMDNRAFQKVVREVVSGEALFGGKDFPAGVEISYHGMDSNLVEGKWGETNGENYKNYLRSAGLLEAWERVDSVVGPRIEAVTRRYAEGREGGPAPEEGGSREKVKPYQGASDRLMGFSSDRGSQKGYDEQGYSFTQPVRVTFPGEEPFSDEIKGLNQAHALERARRNWDGAEIEAEGPGERLNRNIEGAAQRVDEFIDTSGPAVGLSTKAAKIDDTIQSPGLGPVKSLHPKAEAAWKRNKGIGATRLLTRIAEGARSVATSFRRHFPFLDPETDGRAIDIFRRFQEVSENAKNDSYQVVKGFMAGFGPNKYDLFSRNIVLPDLLKDVENGLYDPEPGEKMHLPQGYESVEQLKADVEHFRKFMEANPDVAEAVGRRNDFMMALREDLVNADLLKPQQGDDPRYFHHQVLEYMALKRKFPGTSSKDVRLHRKGWQISRTGAPEDYNTEYVEAEFEVIAQSLAQLRTKRFLNEIKRGYDVSEKLRFEAKQMEKEALEAYEKSLSDPTLTLKEKAALKTKAEEKVDWRSLLPEGYRLWQPVPGNKFFLTHSVSERVLDDLVDEVRSVIKDGEEYFARGERPEEVIEVPTKDGDTIEKLIPAKDLSTRLSRVLALGGPKEQWAIPENVAKTMDEFRAFPRQGPLSQASRWLMSSWKQWTLLNPFRVIKYNVNNMSGDFDIVFAYDPKILKYATKGLAQELWQYHMKGKSFSSDMREAIERGITTSGLSIQEIPDIREIGVFRGLTGEKSNVATKYWDSVSQFTQWRENLLRLAAYKHFKAELAKGRKLYGASNPAEIDAIKGPNAIKDKAAKLARELVGDYGNLSESGQWLRNHLIPFYSWIEINTPRYFRMLRNAELEGRKGEAGARAVGVAGKKAGMKTVSLAARALVLFAAVKMWNSTFFPKEEEELGDFQRRQLHLILGRRDDGTIRSIRFQGALSDALDWVSLDSPIEDAKAIASGEMSVTDKLKEMAKAPINKLYGAIRPEKGIIETVGGVTTWPDLFNPRPVRDKKEAIAKTFSADIPYRHIAGKPTRGLVEDLRTAYSYNSDPGESAYHSARSMVIDWVRKNGRDIGMSSPTERSNALYYYRQAIRYGDEKAAEKYLQRYYDLGGTDKGLDTSIKRAHPLSMLKKDERQDFLDSLSARQRKVLERAEDWYDRVYGGEKNLD